jgi:radical SAM superfamily enzyme YgiQ (UPF0313 family)
MGKVTKIFLADLAHTYSVQDSSMLVPLNIGYLKAYAVAMHGSSVDIKLFKHPEKILSCVEKERPDVIGFSSYGWNENLNRVIGSHIRKILPDALIVAGGPNIDPAPEYRLEFLKRHSYLDFLVIDSGEEPFSELISWWRDENRDYDRLPENVAWRDGDEIIASGLRPLKKTIENIPSPYLGGYLDEFLDAGMVPMLESNRGCPYKCTFCAWGAAAKDKVSKFDLQTTLAEVEYLGRKTRARNWIIVDANFGMLSRDVDIAKAVRNVKDTTGFPDRCHMWLAKNVTERNIEIGEIFGDMVDVHMAMQSMDERVLKNIKRSNISLDTYISYHERFHRIGSDTLAELIIPMPGETVESHKVALRELLDIGVDVLYTHNIRMLAGAETNSIQTRKDYKFKTRYRLIHGDAGIYQCPDGTTLRAFEYEESVRETNTFDEPSLFFFRKVQFLIDCCWNLNVYKPLLKIAQKYDINPLDVFFKLLETPPSKNGNLDASRHKIAEFFQRFDEMSHTEWFDSAEDIEKYFADETNFQRLINQEFDKLNILFSVILLKDYKPAFDTAILESIASFGKVPETILQDVGAFVVALFPPLHSNHKENTISIPDNLVDLSKESRQNFSLSDNRKQMDLIETPKRREAVDLILETKDETLSKVLNTRGNSSLFLRNLQMVPDGSFDSDSINQYLGLSARSV